MDLKGGALAQNVIWAVSGTVTFGVGATFQGTILTQTNIVMPTNATLNGCMYLQSAVTLQMASVLCNGAAVVPPTTPSSPSSTTPTASPSSTVATATCVPTASSTALPTAPCHSAAFQNLNASIVADDYLGFTLTNTVEGLSLQLEPA